MVAQPTRNTPFGNLIVPHTMDQPWVARGLDQRGQPAQDGSTQAPVLGTRGDGTAHGLPHLPQLQWQQRPRGQNFPVNMYAMPEAMLPPPVPPGMPEPGHQPTQSFNMDTPSMPMPLLTAATVPVPMSNYGESVAPQGDDLEAGTPGNQQPQAQAAWMGGLTPSQSQQQGLDLAMLTATMQSMALSLQQLMGENQLIREQMKQMTQDKEKPNEKTGVQPEAGARQPEQAGGAAGVRRPLIGAFDGAAPQQDDVKDPKPREADNPGELKDIDKKDVALPTKYKGDINQWRHWFLKFNSFLSRRDHRWGELLGGIRSNSQNPYGPEDELAIFQEINVTSKDLQDKFKYQLYEYLETYTEGLAHGMVIAGGTTGAMEVFRMFCDEGFSTRDRHLRREYRRVTHPRQATFEGLRKAIMDWETELTQYQAAAGTEMSEKERIICLEDICPDLLQQHLDSKENLKTYGQYKIAISDYLSNRSRWLNGKARVNWLGISEDQPQPGGGQDDPRGDGGDEDWVQAQINSLTGDINALVRNKLKGGKGFRKGGDGPKPDKGKGDGSKDVDMPDAPKDNSWKNCYECNEKGHVGADCPVRKARVAAGGPERLPRKSKGEGKGKGGKNGWPTKAQWGGFYPGPSQAQWGSWYPQPPPKGGVAAFGQQEQAGQGTPQTVLQSLFTGPNQLSLKSIVQKKPPKSFDTGNSFRALESKDEEKTEAPKRSDMPITADFKDFVRPPRRAPQGKKKFAAAYGCCGESCSDDACRAPLHQAPLATPVRHVPESGGIESPTDEPTLGETPWSRRRIKSVAKKDETETSAEDPGKPMKKSIDQFLNFINSSFKKPNNEQGTRVGRINMLNKVVQSGNLMPVVQQQELDTAAGKFEVMSCIVDSGATVPVMNPATGKAYDLMESEASREGVLYELANNDTLPNLGEKRMAVLTAEGTLRGYGSQCADVGQNKPLQAVRSLVKSKHAVCFGLGENGDEHVIFNKQTGEVNMMRDDGINYLQDLLIVPPDKVDEVAAGLMQMQVQGQAEDGQGFGRPGP